jgi:hypothetical protein
MIADTLANFYFPTRPDFPDGGSELDCPHCGTKSTYKREDLIYRGD